MSVNGEMLSEAFGGEWEDAPAGIWERLGDAAARYPDRLAVACLHQHPNLYGVESSEYPKRGPGIEPHLRWTYAQLSSAAGFLGAGLRTRGLEPGSAIVTMLPNGVEIPLVFWSAHGMGWTFVPVNPRALGSAREMRHMLEMAGVAAVVVADADAAAAFDLLEIPIERELLKIVAGEGEVVRGGWTSVSAVLELGRETLSGDQTAREMDVLPTSSMDAGSKHTVTILFTSGTTSLPKGCPHTNLTLNAFTKNLSLGGTSPTDVFCAVLPNNHAMGYFWVLHFLCTGGAVVYPTATFDATQMEKALTAYTCTHTTLVPTALHSLLECVGGRGIRFPALSDTSLCGAAVSPGMVRDVIRILGSQHVSTGFGMTEGSPVWTAPVADPEEIVRGDDVLCGTAAPGARVRICAPDSTRPLPRGEPGEIHESGPGVIAGYVGEGVGAEMFYEEDGRTWFRTGDRGVMWGDGKVSVVGRYKDMIIRGGENIAPTAIEAVLNQFPGIEAQVVGVTDPIAGEVPVAVVRKLPAGENSTGRLQETVRKHMGVLYVPDEVLTMAALGLDDYPRTMSGKIQKSELKKVVAMYWQNRDSEPEQAQERKEFDSPAFENGNGSGNILIEDKSVEETVLQIWWKATGIKPSDLDTQSPTLNFADSITLMRVRGMYQKALGVTLSSAEMAENADLQSQMRALRYKVSRFGNGNGAVEEIGFTETVVPLTLERLQEVIGPENDTRVFKEKASKALKEQGFDFDEDVRSVVQMNDFIDVMERQNMIQTWNFGLPVTTEGCTVAMLKEALTVTLTNNSMWTSFYEHGEDGTPFYITMKPKQKLFDHILIESGSVANVAELSDIAYEYPYPEHSRYPGPLFHALLYNVEDTQSAGFVAYISHIMFDASSMRLFFEDLDRALIEPARPLRPHVPFELWADVYYALRNSPRATSEVNWHVKRLADIHLHRKALYPPAKLPRKSISSPPYRYGHTFDVSALLNLKKQHPHLTASAIFKAAMALVNIARTKHTHALFSNFEAARSSFPFWPSTFAHLPGPNGLSLADIDASDVAGPTMSAITNIIAVDYAEPAIEFLNRIQAEQRELTKYAHAPWRRIIAALNALHPGENAGEMLHEAFKAQVLTWVPGSMGEYERIRPATHGLRAEVGLVIAAGAQATTYQVGFKWEVANYCYEEVVRFAQDLEGVVRWLVEEGNWGVGVGGCLGAVG